ncbi:MAG: alpha/beta hydrolase-fold protein [Pseudomonadota bacterium]
MRLASPIAALLAAVLALAVLPAAAQGCGSAEAPCRVPLGTYRVALPEDPAAGPRPVLVHFHGGGRSGSMVVANPVFRPFLDAGWVVVAPDGLAREGASWLGWNLYIPNGGRTRDEPAFARQVLEDAARRFGVDRRRAVASGYSVGGSAIWNIACRAPDLFHAWLPVAGGFWRPHPEVCAGPVRLLHVHGWQDGTVPLEGRPIRGVRLQGDVFEGLQVWRAVNGCESPKADLVAVDGPYWTRSWTGCAAGSLTMLLHPGGHSIPAWWPETALAWLSRRAALR